jgi:hypothetical protein
MTAKIHGSRVGVLPSDRYRTPLMGLEDASAIPGMRATNVSALTEGGGHT